MPGSVPATPSSGVKRSRTDDSDANDGDKTKTSVFFELCFTTRLMTSFPTSVAHAFAVEARKCAVK